VLLQFCLFVLLIAFLLFIGWSSRKDDQPEASRDKGWTKTWSLSLHSFRPLPEDMQPLIAYRVRVYAANPSVLKTCRPASRLHASGRVFHVHEPVAVLSVHVSRRVQQNLVTYRYGLPLLALGTFTVWSGAVQQHVLLRGAQTPFSTKDPGTEFSSNLLRSILCG